MDDYLPLTITLILLLFVSSRGIFVDKYEAERALEKQGYSEIRVTEKHWFFVEFQGCGSSDAAKFDAIAINPAGKEVDVFVCTGLWFKGSTIRTD